jgi:hypothetical protein
MFWVVVLYASAAGLDCESETEEGKDGHRRVVMVS